MSFSSSQFPNNGTFDVNSLNLASLSLNESNLSSQRQGLPTRGWGSQETRKAYATLNTLADAGQDNSQRHETPRVQRSHSGTTGTSYQQPYDYSLSDDEMDSDEDNFW
jgi:hypothetical protein